MLKLQVESIRIVDVNGREVYKDIIQSDNTYHIRDISGIYQLSIASSSGVDSQKVVVY